MSFGPGEQGGQKRYFRETHHPSWTSLSEDKGTLDTETPSTWLAYTVSVGWMEQPASKHAGQQGDMRLERYALAL